MANKIRAAFYNSQAWKNTAREYKRSVGGLCERCYAQGIVEPGVIVHHKIYLTDQNLADTSISLDFANLELLCRQCHAEEHSSENRKQRNKNRRWSLNEDGTVSIAEKSEDKPHICPPV